MYAKQANGRGFNAKIIWFVRNLIASLLADNAQYFQGVTCMNIINLILAIFLPPVGAFLQVGLTKHFFINVILTLLGFLPGVIHAVWLVATNKSS